MAELDDVPVDELMNENDDKAALQMFKYGNRQQVCFKFHRFLIFSRRKKKGKKKKNKEAIEKNNIALNLCAVRFDVLHQKFLKLKFQTLFPCFISITPTLSAWMLRSHWALKSTL